MAGSAQVPVQPPRLEASEQQSDHPQQARLAAERRATAEVQRGIGDIQCAQAMQVSSAFADAAASQGTEVREANGNRMKR